MNLCIWLQRIFGLRKYLCKVEYVVKSDSDPLRSRLCSLQNSQRLTRQVPFLFYTMELFFTRKLIISPNSVFTSENWISLVSPTVPVSLKICLICNAFRTTVIRVCIWLDYSEAWLSAITILEFSTMELFLLVGSIEYFFWMLLRWMVLLLCARFITISLSWSYGCDLGFWVTVVIHLTKKTRSGSGYLTFWKVSEKRPLFE